MRLIRLVFFILLSIIFFTGIAFFTYQKNLIPQQTFLGVIPYQTGQIIFQTLNPFLDQLNGLILKLNIQESKLNSNQSTTDSTQTNSSVQNFNPALENLSGMMEKVGPSLSQLQKVASQSGTVLGDFIQVNEKNQDKSFQEKTLEFAQYTYCKKVVTDWEINLQDSNSRETNSQE
jgi:hypothetical protein